MRNSVGYDRQGNVRPVFRRPPTADQCERAMEIYRAARASNRGGNGHRGWFNDNLWGRCLARVLEADAQARKAMP